MIWFWDLIGVCDSSYIDWFKIYFFVNKVVFNSWVKFFWAFLSSAHFSLRLLFLHPLAQYPVTLVRFLLLNFNGWLHFVRTGLQWSLEQQVVPLFMICFRNADPGSLHNDVSRCPLYFFLGGRRRLVEFGHSGVIWGQKEQVCLGLRFRRKLIHAIVFEEEVAVRWI